MHLTMMMVNAAIRNVQLHSSRVAIKSDRIRWDLAVFCCLLKHEPVIWLRWCCKWPMRRSDCIVMMMVRVLVGFSPLFELHSVALCGCFHNAIEAGTFSLNQNIKTLVSSTEELLLISRSPLMPSLLAGGYALSRTPHEERQLAFSLRQTLILWLSEFELEKLKMYGGCGCIFMNKFIRSFVPLVYKVLWLMYGRYNTLRYSPTAVAVAVAVARLLST